MSDGAMPPAELRAATLRGLRWTVIARPVSEFVALGSMVVLARLVSPAEFGRYAISAIALDLAGITVVGVGGSLVQRKTVTREHLQAAFALALLSSVALVAVTLVVAELIITPIFGARTAFLVALSTPLCLILGASTVPTARLQRRLSLRRLSAADLCNAIIRAVASIALAIAGLRGEALVLGALLGGVASTVLLWCWAAPPLPRLRRREARELIGYGGPASLAAASWVGFRNCDYAIVGARLGTLSAGFYYRAYTLAVEYQKKVSQVLGTVGFPVLARTGSRAEADALRTQMIRRMTMLLFPCLTLGAALAPVAMPWLFGPRWNPAITPTQILAIGGASTLAIDAVGTALMASGRARSSSVFGWAHFAAYAAAVVVVSPLGLNAVAGAAAFVHTVFLFYAYAILAGGVGGTMLRTLWHDLSPAVIGSTALAAVAWPLTSVLSQASIGTFPSIAVVSALSTLAYLGALRALYPVDLRALLTLLGRVLPSLPSLSVPRRAVSQRLPARLRSGDRPAAHGLHALDADPAQVSDVSPR
jgi:O-antigen/teichoic acid export membrane protein